MKVLKFGGSSVATPDRILNIIGILKSYYSKGEKFTVIFSAFGGVTDQLIQMAELASEGKEQYLELFADFQQRHQEAAERLLTSETFREVDPYLWENHEVLKNLLHGIFLVREVSPRTMDYVLSFGERNSAFLISYALRDAGVRASYLDARKIIKTNKDFGSANVDLKTTFENIQSYYEEHPDIQIVTGFIASAKGGLTTTLGRGGSDYTASLLAAGLEASVIEIWTDVNGVLTSDPRKVKKAFTIPKMTYAEAMEMSHFGAKVIYPPTLVPAMQKGIPLYIKNTFYPDFEGTYISAEQNPDSGAVKGISSVDEITLLTLSGGGLFGIPGIAARLFGALAKEGINIILITQGSSEHSISFAIHPRHTKKAQKQIEEEFKVELTTKSIEPIRVEESLAVVAIIGENMRYQPGIAGRMFQALGKNGINAIAIAQGSSELNISVVIEQRDEAKALNALHEAFFLSDKKVLHLFSIGVGLIGSTLIEQVKAQRDYLREERNLELKIVGLSNSRKMLFDEEGIDLDNWKSDLAASDQKANAGVFIKEMKQLNLPNSIFLDNTASEKVPGFYEQILEESIPIVTPNKVAASSSFLEYQRLKTIARKRGVPFLYETNVGAGLPVLSTLQDLIQSGDRIQKIEGVLSGSLSYIFNHFGEEYSFSSIVKDAREKGFTEPDPRTDLEGVDVKRKLVILAREAGIPLEGDEVAIESFLPQELREADSVEEFMQLLPQYDQVFEQKRMDATEGGCVLRMLAVIEGDQAKIKLTEVDAENPFYNLSGSDNMIVFTTDRYKERPLVIRGPGAGAEVTAAGVFAEIISIGNYIKQ
jgi:aspartokinase/homoserine dehydrogenase 1